MKRVLAITLVCCLLFMSTVFEAKANGQTLLDVLKTTNQNLLVDILDREHWHESMQNINIENKPMLLVYNLSLPSRVRDTYESIVSYAHENISAEIYLLQDEPILLREYMHKTQLAVVADFETPPTFVQDVMNGYVHQSFLGEHCTISNIICFTRKTTHQETAVVYDTDRGRYVRYYENENAPAVEYTWSQYAEYAKAYQEYITSYEYNYNSEGYLTSGQSITFIQFCEDPSRYINEGASVWKWITPLVIILGVGAIAFCGYKLYRRRRG